MIAQTSDSSWQKAIGNIMIHRYQATCDDSFNKYECQQLANSIGISSSVMIAQQV